MDVVRVQIHEHAVVGRRLGRHIEHDPRSREYAVAEEGVTLQKVLHRRHGSVFNQGNLGSCTGNAAAGAINTEPLYRSHLKHLLYEKNAVDLYSLATRLDGVAGMYPPDDTGSSGIAAAKAARNSGYIASYKHAFGIKAALVALQSGPVITGVNWYESFDSPNATGFVQIGGQVRGGHEFEVVGYDPSTNYLAAVNSWGKDWGNNGYFFFTVDTWAQLLAERGDVTALVP